jgi:hypothetical protein
LSAAEFFGWSGRIPLPRVGNTVFTVFQGSVSVNCLASLPWLKRKYQWWSYRFSLFNVKPSKWRHYALVKKKIGEHECSRKYCLVLFHFPITRFGFIRWLFKERGI